MIKQKEHNNTQIIKKQKGCVYAFNFNDVT